MIMNIINNMTKKEIDDIIIKDWNRLSGIVQSYIRKSKLVCDLDIMTVAYESILKNKKNYEYSKDVIAHFLKLCKDSTIWTRSKYQYKNRSREFLTLNIDVDTKLSDDHFIDLIEDDSEDYYNELDDYENYIYEYKKECKREEQLAIEAYLGGYNTVKKFAEYTKMPNTNAFFYLQKLKLKLRFMKIKEEYKGMKITKKVLGLGEITIDCDKEYSQEELFRLKKYFSDLIDDLDTQIDEVIEEPKKKKKVSKSRSKVTKTKK